MKQRLVFIVLFTAWVIIAASCATYKPYKNSSNGCERVRVYGSKFKG